MLRDEELGYLNAYIQAVDDEENLLKQQSKVEWLKGGDHNTSYFHKVVKGRQIKGRICSVSDMEGNYFEGKEVGEVFVKHFSGFMGRAVNVKPVSQPLSLFYKRLPRMVSEEMVKPITFDEIKAAMFDIDDDKAPGPDDWRSKFPDLFRNNPPLLDVSRKDKFMWLACDGKLKNFSIKQAYFDLSDQTGVVQWSRLIGLPDGMLRNNCLALSVACNKTPTLIFSSDVLILNLRVIILVKKGIHDQSLLYFRRRLLTFQSQHVDSVMLICRWQRHNMIGIHKSSEMLWVDRSVLKIWLVKVGCLIQVNPRICSLHMIAVLSDTPSVEIKTGIFNRFGLWVVDVTYLKWGSELGDDILLMTFQKQQNGLYRFIVQHVVNDAVWRGLSLLLTLKSQKFGSLKVENEGNMGGCSEVCWNGFRIGNRSLQIVMDDCCMNETGLTLKSQWPIMKKVGYDFCVSNKKGPDCYLLHCIYGVIWADVRRRLGFYEEMDCFDVLDERIEINEMWIWYCMGRGFYGGWRCEAYCLKICLGVGVLGCVFYGLLFKKLPRDISDSMVLPVTDDEVKAAMFDIDDDKAPGPDGYSAKFFKAAWSVVGNERLYSKDCKVLIDKVRKKVNDWKNKSLSFAGRQMLIKSVLSSMQVYWASVFLLPVNVIEDIERLLNGFLWAQGEDTKGKVWNNLKDVAKLQDYPNALEDCVKKLERTNVPKRFQSILQRLMLAAMTYFIWQERNLRLFQQRHRTVEEVSMHIKQVVRMRLMGLTIYETPSTILESKVWGFHVHPKKHNSIPVG
ncbi:hypothetical protein QVD17_29549 [Tagetes erecta]|uniref:Uncharacterized protein n=1 Tax=Tagetes erecta TaxID=13708 RepID=A0AAD8K1R9_TARER|nr:hypothetical protein QVD17_29549 [Tagetes erecta]